MRALVLASLFLVGLAGCAQSSNRTSVLEQPQLLAVPRAVYSDNEYQAMQVALTQYVQDNGANLSKYRPVVVRGTILPAGTLEGQSYRPGSAMLRQLGYLAFDAPDVQIWIDAAPAGCVRGRCTFVGHIQSSKKQFVVPIDY